MLDFILLDTLYLLGSSHFLFSTGFSEENALSSLDNATYNQMKTSLNPELTASIDDPRFAGTPSAYQAS